MSVEIDVLDPNHAKRVAIVVSNPAVSKQTGWPIGFWWGEVTHPYWEFTQPGDQVEIFSPNGGQLQWDKWSDPPDDSKYSADDLISLGFIHSPETSKLIEQSKPIKDLKLDNFHAVLFVGGQGPMYTFFNDERVHRLAVQCYEAGKVLAVICHPTCMLLKLKLSNGKL